MQLHLKLNKNNKIMIKLLLEREKQTTNNPYVDEIEDKIMAFKRIGLFREIVTSKELNNYSKKIEQCTRPEKSPKVFITNHESFLKLQKEIKTWKVSQDMLLKSESYRVHPQNAALFDTFFWEGTQNYFDPAKYFCIIDLDPNITKYIETNSSDYLSATKSSNLPKRKLVFGPNCYQDKLPDATDPFNLNQSNIDLFSEQQVYFGDTIMYPYIDESGKLVTTLLQVKLTNKKEEK